MPRKTTIRRKRMIKGAGIMDVLQSIYDKGRNVYNKVKSANEYLKEKKFAGNLLSAIPLAGNIPILGTALNAAA
jgi:hypothetical protein